MKTYQKGLIILSAIFILPTFALAAEPADMDSLDVTMTVVESPQDSPREITNRIDVPTEEYLEARERNRRQEKFQKMAGDRDHEAMAGSQEMMQDRQQDMMQDRQQEMMQDQQQEMMQDQQQEMMQDQQQDMQADGTGGMGGGKLGM